MDGVAYESCFGLPMKFLLYFTRDFDLSNGNFSMNLITESILEIDRSDRIGLVTEKAVSALLINFVDYVRLCDFFSKIGVF